MVQFQTIGVANEMFAHATMFDLAIVRSTGCNSTDNGRGVDRARHGWIDHDAGRRPMFSIVLPAAVLVLMRAFCYRQHLKPGSDD
jgi:hypothetical protein